ncbi:MAG TPA: ACP S-malonyltransferase [Anaerolineae bacterium]|nr:ACP S-malonyltransferase [Anaerolineae bacterium]
MQSGTAAKTALLFPGQGSQFVGMGRDLIAVLPAARAVYEQADDILGFRLSDLCFDGPEEILSDTAFTQPALFVTSLAILQALRSEGSLPSVGAVAGHSLGELTALAAAGALGFADGLRLTRERGRLMRRAGELSPGGMAAVLKMSDAAVDEACREASLQMGQPVQIANHNAPEQVVISGDSGALALATVLLRARGARRIVPLAVSIAAHSPLMASVEADYRRAVQATPVNQPSIPIIGNVAAGPLESADAIRTDLVAQLTCPVRWTDSIERMAAMGISHYVEIGPKDVLSKLVKRIVPDAEVLSIGDVAAVRSYAPREGIEA